MHQLNLTLIYIFLLYYLLIHLLNQGCQECPSAPESTQGSLSSSNPVSSCS